MVERSPDQIAVVDQLLELSLASADADTFADIARVLSEIAAPLVGAANAAVATWAAGDDVIRVFQGPSATHGNASLSVIDLSEPTPLTNAIRNRTTVHIHSEEAFATRFPKIARRTNPGDVKAMMTYPLVLNGDVLGSCFFRFADDTEVGDVETRLMEQMVAILVRSVARIMDRRALVTHAKRLEQSNRDLDDFAAVVAHDLSAPVRRIGSFLQLLERELGDLSGRAEGYASTIREQVHHLDALLRDTLRYAQVVAPTDAPAPTDLNAVVAHVLDVMAPELRAVDAHVQHGELPIVRVEESLIRQVFQNLIDNSIKYRSDERPLAISVNAVPSVAVDQVDRQWRISVADNGIGIDPTNADKLFSMFHRLDASSDRPGTGVGLAFIKRVVERHGGTVGLGEKTAAGSGTEIWFTLPMIDAADVL